MKKLRFTLDDFSVVAAVVASVFPSLRGQRKSAWRSLKKALESDHSSKSTVTLRAKAIIVKEGSTTSRQASLRDAGPHFVEFNVPQGGVDTVRVRFGVTSDGFVTTISFEDNYDGTYLIAMTLAQIYFRAGSRKFVEVDGSGMLVSYALIAALALLG